MAELKTKASGGSVSDFIESLEDPVQRQDSKKLVEIMGKISGHKPVLWGTSIIGFDSYHYKSERSSQEGDWPVIAFSPRKGKLTLYVTTEADKLTGKYPRLGKFKVGKGCIYINKLSDVDTAQLTELISTAYRAK